MDLALLPHGERRAQSLLRIPSFGWGPQLSPDGRTVAFERDVPGHEQVYLYDIQTGRLRSLRPGVQASWVDADTLLVQERALDWNPEEESSA
jgi:Tol biopolymer transport system component